MNKWREVCDSVCTNVKFPKSNWAIFWSSCVFSDLSENAIQAVPRRAFRGAADLKNLSVDQLIQPRKQNNIMVFVEWRCPLWPGVWTVQLKENISCLLRSLTWLHVVLINSQLDKNHISCIEEGAFRALRSLEVLWVGSAALRSSDGVSSRRRCVPVSLSSPVCVFLQDAEQQQHQQHSRLQFQPHAQTSHFVSPSTITIFRIIVVLTPMQ